MSNLPDVLVEFANSLRKILENMRDHYHHSSQISVDLPHVGKLSPETLCLCFKIAWECCYDFDSGELLIVLKHGEKSTSYLLAVERGQVKDFYRKSSADPEYNRVLLIDVEKLIEPARRGWVYMLLSLLQDEGMNPFPGSSILRSIQIKPQSLDKVLRWLFPFSGLGILLYSHHGQIAMIFYGGSSPKLEIEAGTSSLCRQEMRAAVKKLRFKRHLSLAIGLHVSQIAALLHNSDNAPDFLSSYGTLWAVSIPLEIDDFIQHFGKLAEFLPNYRKTIRSYIPEGSITRLIRQYFCNLQQFLTNQAIYFIFHDETEQLIVKVTRESICEVAKQDIDERYGFFVPVESLSTVMAWLNEKSLRLLMNFTNAILPEGVLQRISQEDIVIYIRLQDENGLENQLFLTGSKHNEIVDSWRGDFSGLLLHQREIVFSESLLDTFLAVVEERHGYRVHFPLDSIFHGKPLFFQCKNETRLSRGLASLFSESSILKQIVPGICTRIVYAATTEPWVIRLQERQYSLKEGYLLWNWHQGRELAYRGRVEHLLHTWLMTKGAGFGACGEFSRNADWPRWWQDFICATEKCAITIDETKASRYSHHQCHFPSIENEGILKKPTNSDRFAIQSPDSLWQFQFYVLQAWIVSRVGKDSFAIRIRSVVHSKKDSGFAILEFPCSLPRSLEPLVPSILQVRSSKDAVSFYMQDILIFSIEGKEYIRLFYPTWKRKIVTTLLSRAKNFFIKNFTFAFFLTHLLLLFS